MEFTQDSWSFVGGLGARSRDMLAALLDQSLDCVKVLEPDGRIAFINRNGRCALGLDDPRAKLGEPWDSLWPAESCGEVTRALAAAGNGASSRFEALCPTADGTPKWWDVGVTPLHDETGVLFAILAVSRDVTERHQALESMETMAHEMRHRLRNAYAVSGAIALASGREDPGCAEFAGGLATRLNALSAAQSSLIDPGAEDTLPSLVARLGGAFDGGQGLIRAEGLPDVVLGEQAVRLVALVLGELATNSFKHGALGAGGPIALTGSHDGETLRLDWAEAVTEQSPGQGVPREGAGYRLMERMARAHGGRFEVSRSDGELRATLEAPTER